MAPVSSHAPVPVSVVGFPSNITLNVVFSGKVTVEFVNTPAQPSAADLKNISDLTAKLAPPTAALEDATTNNPTPTP